MSERKSLRTSINSVLGAEFFSKVATTLRITDITFRHTIRNMVSFDRELEHFKKKSLWQRESLLGF